MWSAGFYLTCYLACKAWPVMDGLKEKKKKEDPAGMESLCI
jgi:hypothetical protein